MNLLNKDLYTMDDIQTVLNVSEATISNWLKTGVIPGNKKYLSPKEFTEIINSLSSSRLKGRANRSLATKNTVCYLGITSKERKILLKKVIDIHQNLNLGIEESVFSLALSSLRSAKLLTEKWYNNPKSKLDFFLLAWAENKQINVPKALQYYEDIHIPKYNDDFIGAFYQSVQNLATKSQKGSFYTPAILLQDIQIPPGKKVLDPCCGSGNILLQVLNEKHDSSQIYAWDIDD
ncbi:MAG: N-6 DNA methylase, partial [Peptococcaceae bacterium]|nr:N-6 DNA methylase [Peptococcaceae bacterium]